MIAVIYLILTTAAFIFAGGYFIGKRKGDKLITEAKNMQWKSKQSIYTMQKQMKEYKRQHKHNMKVLDDKVHKVTDIKAETTHILSTPAQIEDFTNAVDGYCFSSIRMNCYLSKRTDYESLERFCKIAKHTLPTE